MLLAAKRLRPVVLARGLSATPQRRWSSSSSSPASAASPTPAGDKAEPHDEGSRWVPYAVLGVIGALGGWFWRASQASTNRNKQLELAESRQALEYNERLELRERNGAALSATVLDQVARGCARDLGSVETECEYPDFVRAATRYVDRPLEVAHYLDRVVVSRAASEGVDKLPLGFYLAVLALAVGGSPEERARSLARLVEDPDGNVSTPDAIRLISWLRDAGHVPASVQVVETEHRYPVQHFAIRSPADLLAAAAAQDKFNHIHDADYIPADALVRFLLSKALSLL